MKITKWYADCVSPEGDVFIGYSARVGMGPLTLPYQATLTGSRGGSLRQRTALTSHESPRLEVDSVTWRCPGLGLTGTWARGFPSFRRVLLDTRSVTVDWRCHVPGAAATVGAASAFRGSGYVEELRVRGNPAAIPIRELRWGRFVGEKDSVVWIRWLGPLPLTLVLHDGIETTEAHVTDNDVCFSGHRLGLGGNDAWTLRDEVVGESVFPRHAWLRPLLPRALSRLHEVKWAAPGRLEKPDGTASSGWIIHERVTWP